MADQLPNRGWRHQGKKAPPTTPAAAGGGKRDWQKQSIPIAEPRKPWSRGSKLALATALLSALTCLAFVVFEWIRPVRPTSFVLVGSSYFDNLMLPPNLYGWQGLLDLEELIKEKPADKAVFSASGRPTRAHGPAELKGERAWEKEWPKFSGAFTGKTAVLFVALHGGVERNEAFFHIGDDDRGRERLPLKDLLKSLKGRELADKKVVLLLEPALVQAHWPTGMLQNDFVAKLKAIEKEIEDQSNLIVLCASDVHQVSWVSEEWRQTIFTHYVIEGLQGAADADRNERVTAGELYEYVLNRVQSWSQLNRAVDQSPILLGGRARADSIEITQVARAYKERSPGEAPGVTFTYPPALEEAWRACQKLNTQVPHPEVYSPHLWRRFLDTLVRYEQVLRFGDPAKAAELQARLGTLGVNLRTKARLEQASASMALALPMPEVLGSTPNFPDAELDNRLKELWNTAKDEKRLDKVNELMAWSKEREDSNSTLFRIQVYRRLLDFFLGPLIRDEDLVGKDGGENRSKAQAMLELLETKLNTPRPAEVHFLTMLLSDVSRTPPPSGELLKQAIRTRLLAERTALGVPDNPTLHPYGEVIVPWIQAKFMDAEALRRPGEDWLFGNSDDAWRQASKWLKQAEVKYADLQRESAQYREALRVRDRVVAEFPYLAQWIAAQRPTTSADREKTVEGWAGQITALADQVQKLKAALEQEQPFARELNRLAEQVKADHEALRRDLTNEAAVYSIQIDLQDNWHFREAMLSIPLLFDAGAEDPVMLRRKLLEANRKTSLKFHGSEDGNVPPPAGDARAKKAADESARRNKQMALFTFRLYWPAELAAGDSDSPQRLGEILAERQRHWPAAINDILTQSLANPELKKAALSLRDAEHLARGIPGAFVPFLKGDASEAMRRIRVHDLLLSQANRTVLDHWYPEPASTDRTYYEPVARKYLKDAQALAEDGTEGEELKRLRQASVLAAQENLGEVGLEVDPKSTTYWTSEKRFPVTWTIQAPRAPFLAVKSGLEARVPPGVAMAWRQPFDAGAEWEDTPLPGQRDAIELFPNERGVFTKRFEIKKSDNQKIQAVYNVLFRGQRMSTQTDINPQAPDLIVHQFPPPDRGAISARMDEKFTYGAISIGLDISGSMIWPGKYLIEGRPRLDYALEALDSTLKKIPENTYLSLFAFVTKKNYFQPEIVEVLKSDTWTKARIPEVLRKIRDLRDEASPDWGASPIAYLMKECADRGFPPAALGFRGPRVLLMLTDGDDTDTGLVRVANKEAEKTRQRKPGWPDRDKEPGKYAAKIREYVNLAFQGTDIEVHFVIFNPNLAGEEAQQARMQFQKAVEEDLNPNGRFVPLPEPRKLAEALDDAIRPRLLLEQSGVENPRGGIRVSLPGGEYDFVRLRAGQFTARVKPSGPRELKLPSGEMITVVLKRDPADPKKILYERELLQRFAASRANLLGEPKVHRENWLVTVLENHLDRRNNQLSELISLEETKQAGMLQQTLPKLVWLEVRAKDAKEGRQPPLVRWYREYGYSAPTFRLLAKDWPDAQGKAAPAPSQVQLWSSDYPENPAFSKQIDRPASKKSSDQVRLDETIVEIEDASIESVDVAPDDQGKVGSELLGKRSLVVRVKHPAGQPVLVQLLAKHRGSEHHYFSGANKYTGIFWDLENLEPENFSFNVIFLDALKKSEGTTFAIRGTNQFNFLRTNLRN